MQAPIRVRAKPGVLVPVPRLRGEQAEYVGRSVDHEAFKNAEEDNDKLYPILKEPTEFSFKQHGAEILAEIRRAVRDGDLLEERKAEAPVKTLAQEAAAPAELAAHDRSSKAKG